VGALGADRAGKAGAHPGQVISAIIPARRIGGRVWVVLTSCAGGGRGSYGRGGRGSSLPSQDECAIDARCNNARVGDELRVNGEVVRVDPARSPYRVRCSCSVARTDAIQLSPSVTTVNEEKVTDAGGTRRGGTGGRGKFPHRFPGAASPT
jgi:hypothetical protein